MNKMFVDESFAYYLAGLIDGEGCFYVSFNKNKSPTVRLKISSTDIRLMIFLKEMLGMGNFYPYNLKDLEKSKNRREAYGYFIQKTKDLEKVVELIDGKLVLKQDNLNIIKEILLIIKAKQTERGKQSGKPFHSSELLKIIKLRERLTYSKGSRRVDWKVRLGI